VYQPGQIGLPGRTQLVRGASALLTGLVLPERPGYMGVNLSRQGSVCHTLCSFGSANSSRWDLGNSSTQGLGRRMTVLASFRLVTMACLAPVFSKTSAAPMSAVQTLL
jgi:hypothetical protein